MWRSLVARFVRDEEAVGSNPATPTSFKQVRALIHSTDRALSAFLSVFGSHLGADLEIRLPVASVLRSDSLRHAGSMSRYAAARIYALPESLDELVGPTSGAMTLPRHID